MKWLALVAVLGACDAVFGVDKVSPPADAMIDAPPGERPASDGWFVGA